MLGKMISSIVLAMVSPIISLFNFIFHPNNVPENRQIAPNTTKIVTICNNNIKEARLIRDHAQSEDVRNYAQAIMDENERYKQQILEKPRKI